MTDYSERFKTLATNVIHAGTPQPRIGGAVVSPVFQSANYLMADEATYDEVRYLRLSNSPSHLTLQARLAVIDPADFAVAFELGRAGAQRLFERVMEPEPPRPPAATPPESD